MSGIVWNTSTDAPMRKLRDRQIEIAALFLAGSRQPAGEDYLSLTITLPDCNSCSGTDLFAL